MGIMPSNGAIPIIERHIASHIFKCPFSICTSSNPKLPEHIKKRVLSLFVNNRGSMNSRCNNSCRIRKGSQKIAIDRADILKSFFIFIMFVQVHALVDK